MEILTERITETFSNFNKIYKGGRNLVSESVFFFQFLLFGVEFINEFDSPGAWNKISNFFVIKSKETPFF